MSVLEPVTGQRQLSRANQCTVCAFPLSALRPRGASLRKYILIGLYTLRHVCQCEFSAAVVFLLLLFFVVRCPAVGPPWPLSSACARLSHTHTVQTRALALAYGVS